MGKGNTNWVEVFYKYISVKGNSLYPSTSTGSLGDARVCNVELGMGVNYVVEGRWSFAVSGLLF